MSRFLVGGYTADMGGTAAGVGILRSRPDGSLEPDGLFARAESPSYLVATDARVYAASEGTGRVEAFDRAGTHLGGDSAGGAWPCHLTLAGDTILVSCYGDGSIGVLAADPVRLTATLAADGSGPRPEQDTAHAHSTLLFGDLVLSADLGSDALHTHSLVDGILTDSVLTRTGSIPLPAGSGPRDLVRHPSGLLLVLAELSNEVFVFTPLLELVTVAPIPGAMDGDHAAGISVHGELVFVALRGSNRIAVLALEDAGLVGRSWVRSAGEWPRHHVVDGDVLHVANQLSNSVASFAIAGGALTLLAEPTAVPSPTFLLRV